MSPPITTPQNFTGQCNDAFFQYSKEANPSPPSVYSNLNACVSNARTVVLAVAGLRSVRTGLSAPNLDAQDVLRTCLQILYFLFSGLLMTDMR